MRSLIDRFRLESSSARVRLFWRYRLESRAGGRLAGGLLLFVDLRIFKLWFFRLGQLCSFLDRWFLLSRLVIRRRSRSHTWIFFGGIRDLRLTVALAQRGRMFHRNLRCRLSAMN